MEFGQLTEYDLKIFSLKNHTQNMVEKLAPDPFLKNDPFLMLSLSLDQQSEYLYILVED